MRKIFAVSIAVCNALLCWGTPVSSAVSYDTSVQKNADGSTDVYFGPTAPKGKESNWVPTDPKRRFELLFRLYGPKKELFEKTWKLPDVESVSR